MKRELRKFTTLWPDDLTLKDQLVNASVNDQTAAMAIFNDAQGYRLV